MSPKNINRLNRRPSIHFIGIGGIGISALARWFLAKNWAVSGSDIASSSITKELNKEGIKVRIGHKKANLPPKTSMVVYSSAVGPENPEYSAAKRLGLKPLSYPEAIGYLTRVYETVAVSGSHGKSTTTSILGLILRKAGLDPNVVVGTKLKEFHGKNFCYGRSRILILEADEWKAAFLNYFPKVIISTNIDKEHLDFYKNLENVKNVFIEFFHNLKPGGILVLNKDDKNLFSIHSPASKIARSKFGKIFWYSLKQKEAKEIRRIIKIPGDHNVSNALAALTVANKVFGIKKSSAFRAISEYHGAWRRFEYRGKFKGALVFDDYAHHPTEIKATLKAFKEKYPSKKLICVFQPHQAKRLRALFKEFQSSFDSADTALIMPIYEVAGRDEVSSNYDSKTLVKAIQKKNKGKLIFYLENPGNIRKALDTLIPRRSSPIIVMMGAGDIVDLTHKLIN